jgi:nucleoside-diphosphate-sugar epimerase
MKSILVTGGLGFLGLHLVRDLLEKGESVIAIDTDNYDDEAQELEKKYPDTLGIIVGNLIDFDTPSFIDQIYHLGAKIGSKDIVDDSFQTLTTNIGLMARLLEGYEMSQKMPKIVYASTSEVSMGIENKIPTDERPTIGWKNPFEPRWAYSFSKFTAEMLLVNYANNAPDFSYSIARLSNVYGPRMGHDYVVRSLIMKSIVLAKNEFLVVHSANDTRPFCYVNDAVAGLEALMNSEMAEGQIINIGNPVETSILDLAIKIKELIKGKYGIVPELSNISERRCPNIAKAKALLKWEPKVILEEGLEKTIDWYLKEKHGV